MGILVVFALATNVGLAMWVWLIWLPRVERKIDEYMSSNHSDLNDIWNEVKNNFKSLEKRVNPPAKVSDPFKRPTERFESGKHIIVPKTPDEIRAQNFKEIAEGAEYGHIS